MLRPGESGGVGREGGAGAGESRDGGFDYESGANREYGAGGGRGARIFDGGGEVFAGDSEDCLRVGGDFGRGVYNIWVVADV